MNYQPACLERMGEYIRGVSRHGFGKFVGGVSKVMVDDCVRAVIIFPKLFDIMNFVNPCH